jgi:transcriptional regulator with XRE-family HTH domain
MAATAFADEVVTIRNAGNLSARDIARATGAAPSTVSAWLRHDRVPSGLRAERVAELSAIVERLAAVVDPAYIPVWLHKPLVTFDDDKPLELLARGEYRRVAELISALESPTFS